MKLKIDSFNLITSVIMWFGIIMILSGLSVVIFQTFFYFKKGEWIEMPLILVFVFLQNSSTGWLNNPQSWFGLNKIIVKILELIPLSFFLFAIGCIVAGKTSKDLERSNAIKD